MIKKVFALFLAMLLAQGFTTAQTSMTVPYGSFEQWTSHSGYSVTVLFMPVSVYGSFSTPTGWNYLSYPVNESMTYMGMNINVNTDLPLIIASQETGTVPAGSSAVKLQTFMLSDIVSSTVYSLASGSLDTSLTNMVFPSVLSTGAVNIDHFIPIMNTLISDMDSVESLLASMAGEDVNYYITGGISLGSFEPTRLTGSYKYHSAVSGDNGGVLLLGTRYNSTLHKRELVGGGVNIALTDCSSYTPFTVDYMSLHEYDASYPVQAPDSLIIMLVSSASMNRQQGSWLCVDNLVLWHDTCPDVTGITAVADIHEALLTWGANGSVNGYELEYGPTGFVQGSGTVVIPTGTSYSFSGLAASTQYDVYLRTVCNNGILGDWELVTFTTLQDTCASVVGLSATPDIHEAVITWGATGSVSGYELEYGTAGFVQGNGTVVTSAGNSKTLTSLAASTQYDVYVRSLCNNNVYGDWETVQFTTLQDTCASIVGLSATPDIHEAVITWGATGSVNGYELEYGLAGFVQGSGTMLQLATDSYTLTELDANTAYDVYLRSSCGTIYGQWYSVQFTTLGDTCAHIVDLVVVPGIHEATVSWNATGTVEAYMLEYGPDDSAQPYSAPVTLTDNSYTITGLEADYPYAVCVRAVCGDSLFGDTACAHFTTLTDTTSTDTTTQGIVNYNLSPFTIHLYPNPAHGSVTVDLSEPAAISVLDMMGRTVYSDTILQSGSHTITLPTGVFLLQAVTPAGTATRKIINRVQ